MVVVLPLGGSLCGEAGERLGQGRWRPRRSGCSVRSATVLDTGLVCSYYCVRSATVEDGGGGALPHADGATALVPAPLLLCADHASRYRCETVCEASCPGWRRVRVCLVVSSGVPEVKVGIGRNPYWLDRHRCGGACEYRRNFLEGVRATLPLSSQRIGGKPWQQRRFRRVPSWRC